MRSYFETTVKFEKTAEEGKIVKVTEKYLVDAISFTECENRTIEEMKHFISGEFFVHAIRRAKVNELFRSESGDKWFKSKVNFLSIDEKKGVEKKTPVYMYVQADEIKTARENLVEKMKGSLADWEIESISETAIIDVFDHIAL